MFDRDDERVAVETGFAGAGGGHDVVESSSWRQLDRQLRGVARRRAALDAEEARCLVLAQQLELHRRFGYATLLEYLERTLGYGPRAARERLRVATALQVLPVTAAALTRGDHAYSAVRELTRVCRRDTERAWLDAAAGKTVHEIEAMVAGRKPGDLPGTPVDPQDVRRTLSLDVSAETFAIWRDTRLALELEHGAPVSDDEVLRTLCLDRLAGGAGRDRAPGRAAYQLALTICPSCERATQTGGGRAIEVPAHTAARARCDAKVVGNVDAPAVAKATPTIPPRIRAAVIARDHHRCRVPGCRSSRWIEVHHVQPRAQGGRHTLDNLICLCGGHHDAVHAGRLQITRAPSGDLAFTHADGRRYGAPPTTTRARAEVATHADRATHADLSREQLVQRAIHEEPPP
ncbi:MAG: HNH endonuclease [Kofleriaceae bacterium]|nr:HNH endonuclease [Kofleriaceae bacterium]